MKAAGANVIADPCFFFPTFYSMREVRAARPAYTLHPPASPVAVAVGSALRVAAGSKQVVNTGTVSFDCVKNGLTKYSQNYWQDWLNSWSIWVPAHAVR